VRRQFSEYEYSHIFLLLSNNLIKKGRRKHDVDLRYQGKTTNGRADHKMEYNDDTIVNFIFTASK
jgi:hypothetical protein